MMCATVTRVESGLYVPEISSENTAEWINKPLARQFA
jgi:hypothetical protein